MANYHKLARNLIQNNKEYKLPLKDIKFCQWFVQTLTTKPHQITQEHCNRILNVAKRAA